MIKEIYDNTIDFVIKNVKEPYLNELKNNYFKYLEKKYKNSFKSSSENFLNESIKLEKDYWSNAPTVFKLSQFINDDNYNKLVSISNNIYSAAVEKLHNNYKSKEITDDLFNSHIDKLRSLRDNVEFFNMEYADHIFLETVLDYYYIFKNSNNMSNRLRNEYLATSEYNEIKKKKINN